MEIIRSRNLMLEVIRRLNLYEVPSFTHDLPYIRRFHEIENSNETRQGFKALKLSRIGEERLMTNDEKWRYEKELGVLIGRVLKQLEIRPIAGSMVISVKFTSPSPERAKQIVDTIADVYVNARLNRKFIAARKVTDWLDVRLDTLREELRQAENAVEQYRADKELISGSLLFVLTNSFTFGHNIFTSTQSDKISSDNTC